MSECQDDDGNCTVANDPDGLPAQCVGAWATDKHDLLRRYVEATAEARAIYDGTRPPRGDFRPGGTGYIELFAGPGRARIRETHKFIDGSPLVALKAAAAKKAFTDVVLCDLSHANAVALMQRTASFGAKVIEGDCNKCIDEVVRYIPLYGYNFALVDPFAASVLKFATIERLAALKRMDLVIHFPTGSMKRNWLCDYEELVGLPASKWNVDLVRASDITKLIPVLRRQLVALGYADDEIYTNTPAIKNSSNTVLYHLVFASKHSLGKKIWNSITDTRHNQRSLGF
jgi:three-Cys-motif partner protein